MRLAFKQLDIQNFKTFTRQAFALDREPGLYFVQGENQLEPALGSNGAGKSTLWDALCWCVTGKTPEGLRGPDIQPWEGGGTTSVTLHFEADEVYQSLTRTARPNSLRLAGTEVSQEQVDKLLLDYETLTHTILLGQGRPLFYDLAPREAMALFSNVLNLDRWEARSNLASQLVRQGEIDLEKLRLSDEKTSELINHIEEMLAISHKKYKEWKSEQNTTRDELSQKIEKVVKEVSKAQAAHEKTSHKYEQMLAKRKLAHSAAAKLAAVELNVLDKHERARKLQKELEELGSADTCPTCGQSITGTDLAQHKRELQKTIRELRSATVPEELKARALEYVEIEDMTIALAKERDTRADELSESKSRLAVFENSLAELTDKNPYRDEIEALEGRRQKLSKELTKVRDQYDKQEVINARARVWIKGFKEIRLYQIEELLQELTLATNTALPDVGLYDWQVQYVVEKETKSGSVQRGLSIFVQSPTNKKPVRWESWSGGQRQRLRVVGALALAEVLLNHAGVQSNIEILDEPTQHLSGEGVRDMCDYLADRAKQLSSTIYYADQQSVQSARFSGIIPVVLSEKGHSFVEEEL